MSEASKHGEWMSQALVLAGLTHLAWGVLNIVFPHLVFQWAGLRQPEYPEIWQYAGAASALFGIAFLVAAGNPVRHWLLVLTGLMVKLAGVAGFCWSASLGHFPWQSGWLVLATDGIWTVPLALILREAYQEHLRRRRRAAGEIRTLAMRARTQYGATLEELNRISPVLLVFLRHFGCTFCREALDDLAKQRRAIESQGTRIVLVHMGTEDAGKEFVSKYGLEDVPRISDPGLNIYRAFGLHRGSLRELFGPYVWLRGFKAGILARHGVGKLQGDGFQMPGVFLLFHGAVLRSFIHQTAADRPDYVDLASPSNLSAFEIPS